jgi:5-methylcytosine-specific restriction endonuclease McrA
MERDDFMCKLCNRGNDDGVRLEVDHIIPISKGGKTIMDNLQTLCKDCNRGKRDKMPILNELSGESK